MTFIRYIAVNFKFGLLDCVRYNGDFVIPGFIILGLYSIHFTVTLARLKNCSLSRELCYIGVDYIGVPLSVYSVVSNNRELKMKHVKFCCVNCLATT